MLYVFGREQLDIEDCVSHFRKLFPNVFQHLIVLYDTSYYYAIGKSTAGMFNLIALYRLVLQDKHHMCSGISHSGF